jgi:hypothetical protein
MFKLQSCDILLFAQEGNGIKEIIGRWGIGKWGHVAMIGDPFGVPMLFESTGKGAGMHSLESNRGRLIKVMRLDIDSLFREIGTQTIYDYLIKLMLETAINLISDPQSYYDYSCIIQSCVPRALKTKFPCLPIPLKYHRDAAMVCSEFVAEIFWRVGICVLSQDVVPLPGDFETSSFLKPVAEGRLLVDIV